MCKGLSTPLREYSASTGVLVRKRDPFYDVVKGMGIVFVILGHSLTWGSLPSRMIFSFHMPLFLYVSGVFFRGESMKGRDVAKRIVWGLLFPYAIFGAFATAAQLDVQWGAWVNNPLRQIMVGVHGEFGTAPLWFLMCLASVHLIAWVLCRVIEKSKSGQRLYLMSIVAVALIGIARLVPVLCPLSMIKWAPFMLLSVPGCTVFFWLGICHANISLPCAWHHVIGYFKKSNLLLMGCAIAAFAVLLLICHGNKLTFNLRLACFSMRVLLPCVCGLVMVFASARVMQDIPIVGKFLSYVGRNSLCFFAFEFPVWHIVCRVLHGMGFDVGERSMRVGHSAFDVLFRVGTLLVLLALVAIPVMKVVEGLRVKAKMYLTNKAR